MHVIEKLRNIWTRYGGGFNSLSPYEQDEFIHSDGSSFSLVASSHASSHFSWFWNHELLTNLSSSSE